MPSRRATVLTLVALVAGAGLWRVLPGLWPRRLEITDLSDPPGFRRLAGGEVSRGAAGLDPFLGLTVPGDTAATAAAREPLPPGWLRANLCQALHGDPADIPEGAVPIASFSDIRCPHCRRQTAELADRLAADPGRLHVTWHDWPIFGAPSRLGARAGRAADRQGRYLDMHMALLRSPAVATPDYLDDLAARIGLDRARFRADFDSDATTRALQVSDALAGLFGFAGTPALVVGRTVLQGRTTPATLDRVIEMERDEGWRRICAGLR
jgi:predicted DsbA family dithiol-disulfide isomerase